jgi:hypothetical protein
MDFAKESEHMMYVSEVLVHLKEYMEENPVSYPPAMLVYATLFYGVVPSIHVNCPYDPDCEVNLQEPCGGLCDTADVLDEAFECLDLELDYEASNFHYPSDYSI